MPRIKLTMTKNIKLSDEVYLELFKCKNIQSVILQKNVRWNDFMMTLLELFQDSIKDLHLDLIYPSKRPTPR